MKFFAFTVFAIFITATLALSIFAPLIDLDPHRPKIERFLLDEYGLQARLGHLSFRWHGKPEIHIEGVILRLNNKGTWRLTADHALLGVNPIPFFRMGSPLISLTLEKPDIIASNLNPIEWGAFLAPWIEDKPWHLGALEIREGTITLDGENSVQPSYFPIRHLTLLITRHPVRSSIRILGQSGLFGASHANMSLEADYHYRTDTLDFKGHADHQAVEFSGQATALLKNPIWQVTLDIHQLNLSRVIPNLLLRREHLEGTLTAHLIGALGERRSDTVWQDSEWSGSIDIRHGSFKNINLIHKALEGLIAEPTLKMILLQDIPESLNGVVRSPDSPFEWLQWNFTLKEGVCLIKDLNLKHPEYLLRGAGESRFYDHLLQLDAHLILLEPLSQFLTNRIINLKDMQNSHGRVIIPFRYESPLPAKFEFKPDFDYVQ